MAEITQLKETCPDCGKKAIEKFSIKTMDKEGNQVVLTTLECFHIIKRVVPKATPYETIVSNWWKPEIAACKHEWNKTQCTKCGEFRLFQFQVNTAHFIEQALAVRKGTGAFHEMGLGKTICGLAPLRFHSDKYTPTLYIVKSRIKFQWFKEIYRWLGPTHIAQVLATSRDIFLPGFRSYIISYDLLRKMKPEKLAVIDFKLVIMDECQQIKNVDSGRTQAVRKLLSKPDLKVIALSGTPWKNRGSEFFPVLNMMDPMRFHSQETFVKNWVDFYWDGAKQKQGGIRNPEKFREYVKDMIIRFERHEVAPELPTISRNKLHVQLDELEQKTYDEEVSEFVSWYQEAVIGGEEDALSGIELFAKMSRMRHITGLAKIPATEEFVAEFIEETDRKICVFVHHKDVGEILLSSFREKYGNIMPVMSLSGNMSPEESFSIQERFNKASRCILVASTLASGEGLNLQTGSDCVMHERQWNPANEEQAEGRFIRIGQTASAVTATYVEAEGTIDEHLDMLVETKRNQFNASMGSSKGELKWNQDDMIKQLAQSIVNKFKEKSKGKPKPTKSITAQVAWNKTPAPVVVENW